MILHSRKDALVLALNYKELTQTRMVGIKVLIERYREWNGMYHCMDFDVSPDALKPDTWVIATPTYCAPLSRAEGANILDSFGLHGEATMLRTAA